MEPLEEYFNFDFLESDNSLGNDFESSLLHVTGHQTEDYDGFEEFSFNGNGDVYLQLESIEGIPRYPFLCSRGGNISSISSKYSTLQEYNDIDPNQITDKSDSEEHSWPITITCPDNVGVSKFATGSHESNRAATTQRPPRPPQRTKKRGPKPKPCRSLQPETSKRQQNKNRKALQLIGKELLPFCDTLDSCQVGIEAVGPQQLPTQILQLDRAFQTWGFSRQEVEGHTCSLILALYLSNPSQSPSCEEDLRAALTSVLKSVWRKTFDDNNRDGGKTLADCYPTCFDSFDDSRNHMAQPATTVDDNCWLILQAASIVYRRPIVLFRPNMVPVWVQPPRHWFHDSDGASSRSPTLEGQSKDWHNNWVLALGRCGKGQYVPTQEFDLKQSVMPSLGRDQFNMFAQHFSSKRSTTDFKLYQEKLRKHNDNQASKSSKRKRSESSEESPKKRRKSICAVTIDTSASLIKIGCDNSENRNAFVFQINLSSKKLLKRIIKHLDKISFNMLGEFMTYLLLQNGYENHGERNKNKGKDLVKILKGLSRIGESAEFFMKWGNDVKCWPKRMLQTLSDNYNHDEYVGGMCSKTTLASWQKEGHAKIISTFKNIFASGEE